MPMGPAEQSIRASIEARGRLTFAEFMEAALHGRGGYYASGRDVVGPRGDFYTSPELHPAFGALVGVQAEAVWHALGKPPCFDLIEYGAGSGALARDLLAWGDATHSAFLRSLRYTIVERSPRLVERQRAALAAMTFGQECVRWVEGSALAPIPPTDAGFAIAHELLDALPFHLVEMRDGELLELYVVINAHGRLALDAQPPSSDRIGEYVARTGHTMPSGSRAEVNLSVRPWLQSLSNVLRRGAALVVDYGGGSERLFGAARSRGTLRCYFEHTVTDEPLRRVGRQDVTADVDFTSLRLDARDVGFETFGPIPQSDALRRLGLDQLRDSLIRAGHSHRELDANLAALSGLVDPEGLGNESWLLLARGIDAPVTFAPAEIPTWQPPPILRAEGMQLPPPETLEPLGDFEAMWHDYWSGNEDDLEA